MRLRLAGIGLGIMALVACGAERPNAPAMGASTGPDAPSDVPVDGDPSMPGAVGGTGGLAGPIPAPAAGGSSVRPPHGAGAAGMATLDSDELYDPVRVPRFDIELSPDAVQSLNEEPTVYVSASFSYGSERVSNVGVRMKGEASFRRLSQKAAFKLKFDEFVDAQRFRGLRGMTFNNMVEDPTFISERLSYYFFRSVGLPAPRCNSALVYVNGELYGVYANVETEDKAFLRRWFEDDEGNLYEEGGLDFQPGNEAAFDLETNKSANDRSDLTALFAAIADSEPSTYLQDVGAHMDMEHFLAFTAAEGAVNQWDMYGYTVFYPNNFRIYRDPVRQRFVMLPWGMDISMKPFLDASADHIPLLALARQRNRPQRAVSAGMLFQLCMSSPPCRSAYKAVASEMAERFEQASLVELATTYYDQIKEHVVADQRKEHTLEEFEQAIQKQRQVLLERPAAMRESLQSDEGEGEGEGEDDG